MQISKFVLALVIVGAGLERAYAQPLTPVEQQKALELLRQKITEERQEQGLPAPPARPTEPAQLLERQKALELLRQRVAEERQKPSAPAPAAKPAEPVQPVDQQKALELLRQKLAEERQKPSVSAPATKPAEPAQPSRAAGFQAPKPAPDLTPKPALDSTPKQKPEVAAKPKPEPRVAPAAPQVAESEPRPARTLWDGLKKAFPRTKRAGAEPKQAAGTASAQGKVAKQTKAKATAPTAKMAEETPAAPTQPIQVPGGVKTKQQRLADLLELYKADKIGPAEYHEQRAKIVAEP